MGGGGCVLQVVKSMGLAGPKQTGLKREEAARRSRLAVADQERPLKLASGIIIDRCAVLWGTHQICAQLLGHPMV